MTAPMTPKSHKPNSYKSALDALLLLFLISDTCTIKISPHKEMERYSVELITVKKQAQVQLCSCPDQLVPCIARL